ncbi:WD repeat-containing protein 4 [Rhizoclosmatium hyalinum]|nr:WD repeat-containing protein 4 [Rhizoclosmatium hyalinum]
MTLQSIHGLWSNKHHVVAAYGKRFFVVDAQSNSLVAVPADHAHASSDDAHVQVLRVADMPEGAVRAIAFHRNGELMAVASDSRSVQLWNTKTWSLVAAKPLLKRPNAIAFSGNETSLGDLVVADKFGDVYRIPLGAGSEKAKLLLGHCSLVTDMILSHENGLLITSDRDEKIRVSLFPDTFEIDGFCLGHKGFITKMAPVPNRPTEIISGGGDGTLIRWNVTTHSEIDQLSIAELAEELKPVNGTSPTIITIKSSPTSSAIAVAYEAIPIVSILTVSSGSTNEFRLHTNIQLPRPVLDIEFDHRGDLIVAYAPGTSNEDSLLIGVSEYHKEKDIKFSEISATASIAGKLNTVGTGEATETIDYGAYIQILRKFNEDEYREKKEKRKAGAGESGGGKKQKQGKGGQKKQDQ